MKRMFSRTPSTDPFGKSTKTQNSLDPTVNPLIPKEELPPWWALNEPAPRGEAASAAAPTRDEPAVEASTRDEPARSEPVPEQEPYLARTGYPHLRNYFFTPNPPWDLERFPNSNPPPLTAPQERAQRFFQTKQKREKNVIGRGGRRKTRKRKYRNKK